jgi:hypothetical protein
MHIEYHFPVFLEFVNVVDSQSEVGSELHLENKRLGLIMTRIEGSTPSGKVLLVLETIDWINKECFGLN